jgi:hypothetical protein
MIAKFFLYGFVVLFSGCQPLKRPDGLEETDIKTRLGTCRWDQKFNTVGKLFGDIVLVSSKPKAMADPRIRSQIWVTAMETLRPFSFQKIDQGAGIIQTQWFNISKKAGSRFKICCTVVDNQDWVRSICLQVQHQAFLSGQWRDQPVRKDLAFYIKDAILTSARKGYIRSSLKKPTCRR